MSSQKYSQKVLSNSYNPTVLSDTFSETSLSETRNSINASALFSNTNDLYEKIKNELIQNSIISPQSIRAQSIRAQSIKPQSIKPQSTKASSIQELAQDEKVKSILQELQSENLKSNTEQYKSLMDLLITRVDEINEKSNNINDSTTSDEAKYSTQMSRDPSLAYKSLQSLQSSRSSSLHQPSVPTSLAPSLTHQSSRTSAPMSLAHQSLHTRSSKSLAHQPSVPMSLAQSLRSSKSLAHQPSVPMSLAQSLRSSKSLAHQPHTSMSLAQSLAPSLSHKSLHTQSSRTRTPLSQSLQSSRTRTPSLQSLRDRQQSLDDHSTVAQSLISANLLPTQKVSVIDNILATVREEKEEDLENLRSKGLDDRDTIVQIEEIDSVATKIQNTPEIERTIISSVLPLLSSLNSSNSLKLSNSLKSSNSFNPSNSFNSSNSFNPSNSSNSSKLLESLKSGRKSLESISFSDSQSPKSIDEYSITSEKDLKQIISHHEVIIEALKKQQQNLSGAGDKKNLVGGEQLNFENYKNRAHVEVSDYINNNISKYDTVESETSNTEVFLQNINDKLIGGGNYSAKEEENSDYDGGNIEINSSVSTEHFLDYIENKLNNNLKGGDINNILQDSFIKGMNEGGYLDKKPPKISQQDILNRIRMSGGAKKNKNDDDDDDDDDDEEDDKSSDEDDSSSESSESSSSTKNEYTTKNISKRSNNKKKSEDDSDDDSDSDSDKDSNESNDSNDSDDSDVSNDSDKDDNVASESEPVKKTYKNKKSTTQQIDSESLSDIIVTSEKSITPYMLSNSSLQTEDINLVSFSSQDPKKYKSNKSKSKK